VGDPDQLASVEAGAVLGDLVARSAPGDALPSTLTSVLPDDVPPDPAVRAALRGGVVRLEVVHRHGAVIGRLAAAIREGDDDEVLRLLRAGEPDVTFVETAADAPSDSELVGVRQRAEQAGVALIAAARGGEVAAALQALESHRVLVAHRRGPAGVAHWASLVEQWVGQAWAGRQPRDEAPASSPWYAGRPLMVMRNDRDTGLYNGDTGVVVAREGGGVVAACGAAATPLLVRPHRLPSVETVHATTVHRAPGSQFACVSLVLPPATSPLLTRELLYTAVTRARSVVCVVGTADAVRAAVQRPVRRASGLRES
jgi:exodeoxyribonuclease V alpha subunit